MNFSIHIDCEACRERLALATAPPGHEKHLHMRCKCMPPDGLLCVWMKALRTGGRDESETTAPRMRNKRSAEKYCRGEGCPRADLCRRYMDAASADNPSYFEKSPMLPDGQCGEFASNGWLRTHELQCGGAHPPPRCDWQCEIELHRWEKHGEEWIWISGGEH